MTRSTPPSPSLFAIRVKVNNEERPGQWGALNHVELTLDAEWDESFESASSAELLRAHKWRAGVISRVAVQLAIQINKAKFASKHGCASRYGHDGEHGPTCGELWAMDVVEVDSALAVGAIPYAVITVPAEQADRFVSRAQQLVNQVIKSDAMPAPPDDDPAHGQVLLTESATPTKATP